MRINKNGPPQRSEPIDIIIEIVRTRCVLQTNLIQQARIPYNNIVTGDFRLATCDYALRVVFKSRRHNNFNTGPICTTPST